MTPPDVKSACGAPGVGTIVNGIRTPGSTTACPNSAQSAHGTYQLGQKARRLKVGLRDHSLRTPGQLQQNFPRELAINEAAALAGADPIEFRLRHTTTRGSSTS